MSTRDASLEDAVRWLRKRLPAGAAAAEAIDRRESWQQIAAKAVRDGYSDLLDEFNGMVERVLRRCS
jgi:hypothetical protein